MSWDGESVAVRALLDFAPPLGLDICVRSLSLIHVGLVRCFPLQAEGDSDDDEEDKAPVVAPEPPGTEEEMKERKLLADIDAAVQKEAARQRRLKKTVSARLCGLVGWWEGGEMEVEWCSGEWAGAPVHSLPGHSLA
jgi:hypothetical protein